MYTYLKHCTFLQPLTAHPPDPMPPQTGLTGGASPRVSPYTKGTKDLASYAAHLYLNWKSKGREVGSPIQGPTQEGQHITRILPEVLGLGPGRKGCGNQEWVLQLWQMKLKGERVIRCLNEVGEAKDEQRSQR